MTKQIYNLFAVKLSVLNYTVNLFLVNCYAFFIYRVIFGFLCCFCTKYTLSAICSPICSHFLRSSIVTYYFQFYRGHNINNQESAF